MKQRDWRDQTKTKTSALQLSEKVAVRNSHPLFIKDGYRKQWFLSQVFHASVSYQHLHIEHIVADQALIRSQDATNGHQYIAPPPSSSLLSLSLHASISASLYWNLI